MAFGFDADANTRRTQSQDEFSHIISQVKINMCKKPHRTEESRRLFNKLSKASQF